MWNYRVIRKKNIYHDSSTNKERIEYTYAIHEAYYDKNGFVGAITNEPTEPSGENIEELRHSWLMMAEAFGKPILDYEKIPEPGYELKEDPIGSELHKRVKDFESGKTKSIPWEQVKKDLEERYGNFDEDAYRKQIEDERLEKEKYHSDTFIGISVFEDLIKRIYTDYRKYIKRDITDDNSNAGENKRLLMKISYDDIENAFLFVSMGPMYGNQALVCTKTGKIFYISEYGDSDELPDGFEESDEYIEIPHKNELNLGKRLVFEFVSETLPEETDRVSQIFRKKGAYSKYKNFLEKLGLLDEWHKFEDRKQNEALRKWCTENDIELIG